MSATGLAANVMVRVGMDSSAYTGGARNIEARTKSMEKQLKGMIGTAAKWGAGMAAAAATATAAMVRSGLVSVDAQAKLATQLDTTFASMATVSRGAELLGIEQNKVTASAKAMTINISKAAQGLGEQDKAMKAMNLTAEQLAGLPLDQKILKINNAIRANVPVTEQAATAAALFGSRNAAAMMTFDNETMAEAARQAEVFGTNLSQIDAKRVEQANDAMGTFGLAAKGITQQLAVQFAPVLQAVGASFLDAAEEAGGFEKVSTTAFNNVIKATGFVINAVDGIGRAFTILTNSVALLIAEMVKTIVDGWTEIVKLMAKVPGMESVLDPVITGMENFSGNAESVAIQTQQKISDALNKPMAGETFKQYVADAKEMSDEMAKTAVQTREAFGQIEIASDEVTEKDLSNMQKRLDGLRKSFMDEKELLLLKHDENLESLIEARENELLTEQEYNELLEMEMQRHNDKLTDIEQNAADARNRIAEMEAAHRKQVLSGALGAMTTLMNTENKKMFEIGKKASIAQSLIATYTGMAEALKLGFPMGPIAAAAIGLAGFNNVANIKKQSIGGGGGTASVSAAGAPAQTVQQQQPTNVTYMRGIDPGQLYDGQQIIDAANMAAERGGTLMI